MVANMAFPPFYLVDITTLGCDRTRATSSAQAHRGGGEVDGDVAECRYRRAGDAVNPVAQACYAGR